MAEARTPAPCVSPALAVGNLESQVLSLAADDPRVLGRFVDDLGSGFRKVWFDLIRGFAEFMSPSQAHEFTSRDVHDLILALCHANGTDVVDMGSTSIKAPDGASGGDPDESFLIGERATRYRRVETNAGVEAAMDLIEGQPPDLAIEVEHTHHHPDKISIYRACGVKELWDLATAAAGRTPVIYELQAEGGLRPRPESDILPGVSAERLPAAVAALRDIGGPLVFAEQRARGEAVDQRLLDTAGGSLGRKRPPKAGGPRDP